MESRVLRLQATRLQVILQLPELELCVELHCGANSLMVNLERVETASHNLQRRCRAEPLVVAKHLEIDDAHNFDKERNGRGSTQQFMLGNL